MGRACCTVKSNAGAANHSSRGGVDLSEVAIVRRVIVFFLIICTSRGHMEFLYSTYCRYVRIAEEIKRYSVGAAPGEHVHIAMRY